MKKGNRSKTNIKEVTTNELAQMVNRGFEDVRKEFKISFDRADKKFEVVFDEIRLVKADIRDIKTTLGPLVQIRLRQGLPLP